MIYYVDGYNLIFHGDYDEEESLERLRNNCLENLGPRAKKLSVVVVFDAHNQEGLLSSIDSSFMEVVFTSHGQSADDYIIERLQFAKNPTQCTVVTHDRQLIKRAREYRARSLNFQKFFTLLRKKS